MKIAEIYQSIQGEGFRTGTPSVFVRFSGCNLRCWYCDTPYTSWSPEGEDLSLDEVLAQVATHDCPDVVVTGGEPMLFSELVPLTTALRQMERQITIETAGTLFLPVACDLMSISPKLSSSTPPDQSDARWRERHERTRHVPEVIRRLVAEYPYQMKFVVDSPADCREVEDYLHEFPEIDRNRVMLMPQGTTVEELAARGQWLEPYCQEHGLHFCPRRHIEWFGLTRGT